MPECARLTYSNLEFQNFSGGPLDSHFLGRMKGRGNQGKGDRGKGEMVGGREEKGR